MGKDEKAFKLIAKFMLAAAVISFIVLISGCGEPEKSQGVIEKVDEQERIIHLESGEELIELDYFENKDRLPGDTIYYYSAAK